MKIEMTLINKQGEKKVIKTKAPSKLALLTLSAKLARYANKNWKLVKIYCDDYQTIGLFAQAVPSDVEITAIPDLEESA